MQKQRKPLNSPSIRQRLALKEITENHVSTSVAMKRAGYAKSTAQKPTNMTHSASFIALMDEMGITDQQLTKTLKEGLEANKVVVMGAKSEESFVDVQPDHPTRHKYLETGLRLKGLGKNEGGTNVYFNNVAQQQRNEYRLT